MFSTMTGCQRWGIAIAESQKRRIHPLRDGLKMKTEGPAMVGCDCQSRGKNMLATFFLLLSIPCSLQVTTNSHPYNPSEWASPVSFYSKTLNMQKMLLVYPTKFNKYHWSNGLQRNLTNSWNRKEKKRTLHDSQNRKEKMLCWISFPCRSQLFARGNPR